MSKSDSPEWEKKTLPLGPNSGWTAKPGYRIFVADRGAVRFDFPESWVVVPGDDSIRFHDRPPPDDDCVLQVSVIRLPPVKGGWSQLPLEALVHEILHDDGREVTRVGEVVTAGRADLELAWGEVAFIDPNEKRPALSRACLARAQNVQPLITMDFWEADAAKFVPVWEEVLRTLQVAVPLSDPTRRDVMN